MKNRNIVCLSSQKWNSHWATPHQIMSRLAEGNSILFVEPLRSPFSLLRRSNKKSTDNLPKGMTIFSPPPIFFPFTLYAKFKIFKRLNDGILKILLQRVYRKIGFEHYIYWVYQVTYSGAGFINQSDLLIYDCIDEWAGAVSGRADSVYVQELDKELCQQADVLFVGSENLYKQRESYNRNIFLVPQGVDLGVFLQASYETTEVPEDLACIPEPRIGLIGVLNEERIDVALLVEIAQTLSVSIVLIGPVWSGLDTDELKKHSSIYLLGNRPIEELGRYLKGIDVCIIPYLINKFTRNIYPLKLHEYLASGKPVVTTAIPACLEFEKLMYIAHSNSMFIEHLKNALMEDNSEVVQERIETAMQNDWGKRVIDKVRVVDSMLATD